ncbi:hypothetical protein Plhal304r1_c036g0110661 [Plasmopara halstedii]
MEVILDDEKTALLNILPDRLAEAYKRVDRVCKMLEEVANANPITMKAIECPLAFSSTLSLKIAGNGAEIVELAQLHTINCVLSATQPGQDFPFTTKWKKGMETTFSCKHLDIVKKCAKWWNTSEPMRELTLEMFELALIIVHRADNLCQ